MTDNFRCSQNGLLRLDFKPVQMTNPPENSSEHFKESCVMSERPKLGFEMWGIRLNAEGAVAIVGAIILVSLVLAFYRF
jgi:hypothetical protein